MIATETARALRAIPLLGNLSDSEIDQLSGIGDLRALGVGAVLIRDGERADNAYLLLSGAARVEIDGHEVGTPVTAGECVGELAVPDDAPRAATVTVTAPTEVIAFSGDAFRGALDRLPALREAVTRALSRRLRQAQSARRDVRGAGGTRRADTGRQRVAPCVAKGLSNARVAAELFVSEHTVASHLQHIYAKLGVSSRVGLATAVLRASRITVLAVSRRRPRRGRRAAQLPGLGADQQRRSVAYRGRR